MGAHCLRKRHCAAGTTQARQAAADSKCAGASALPKRSQQRASKRSTRWTEQEISTKQLKDPAVSILLFTLVVRRSNSLFLGRLAPLSDSIPRKLLSLFNCRVPTVPAPFQC